MGRNVLVSAGHSTVPPVDPGAEGNGYVEAELAVELRDMVAKNLRSLGAAVVTDGADGVNEPLRKAIALAKAADVAVEIHWNASNGSGHGIECLCKPALKPLAKALAGAVHAATGLDLRGDLGWKADDSGQHKSLGFCNAGGVILEVCFIDNENDIKTYIANKGSVARNIANALLGMAGKSEISSASTGPVAPAKKPPPTSTYSHVMLRRGSFNASVGTVQSRLRALGYRDVATDNDFGADTERAVRAFQRKAGLESDGIVGRDTWRALFPPS